MSEYVTCPDCDEKVKVKAGKSSAKCPACGVSVPVDRPARGGGSTSTARRKDDDDREEKKKPKRKYRKEWDDDDDDDAPAKPPPQRGSLAWLWITLGIVAFIAACCGGGVWGFYTFIRKARDEVVQRNEEWQKQVQAGPGNPQGRAKAPAQPDASAYKKRKPFDTDPVLAAGGGPYYLDDLEPFDVQQGAWKFGRHGAMGADDGRWVVVNGVNYDHAIAMHPPEGAGAARASFAVGGQVRRLKGKVALNDDWHDGDAWGTPSFTVYKDGKQVWSTTLKRRKTTIDFDIDVSGARVIILETKAEGSAHDAHCVWLDPVLEK